MITINDNDLPITVAEKIISGTKIIELSPMMKSLRSAIVGKEDDGTCDMFDLEGIKEIADYLIIYYEAHKNGD